MQLKKIIAAVLSAALCVYFFKNFVVNFDWSMLTAFSPASCFWLLLLTVFGTFIYVLLIKYQAVTLGYNPSFMQTYLVLTSSLTANYITPVKIGIPLRIFLYKEIMKIEISDGVSMVSLETFFGLSIPLAISIIGLPIFFPQYDIFPLVICVIFTIFSIVIFSTLHENSAIFRITLFQKGIFLKVKKMLLDFHSTLKQFSSQKLLPIILSDILMLFLQAIRLVVVIQIFNCDITVLKALVVLTISVTVGNLSMIPMGIGARDVSFTLLLVQAGMSKDIAIMCAAIQRLFSPGWPLLLGLISSHHLCLSSLLEKKKNII